MPIRPAITMFALARAVVPTNAHSLLGFSYRKPVAAYKASQGS